MINVWSYTAEYEEEREDILDAVDSVFRSGRLILGESVAGFEREFASRVGASYGIGVDNGTNAVRLALQGVGVRPGDEVVTVANTAAPTVVAIDSLGAVPVFVDVRESDYLMDVAQLLEAITPRTRAILPVHLYGQCVNMEDVLDIAARRELLVVEDCAQAHLASRRGRVAGSMGDASAFSFYPTKVLGAYGDAGLVATSDPNVEAEVRRIRFYGMEDTYYVVRTPGSNSRLDEVQAEILRRKLPRLETRIESRRRIAQRYCAALEDTELVLPTVGEGNTHVYYLFVVRHPERDRILAMLRERGIRLNVSYPWPVHTMTGFQGLAQGPGDLPVTERLASEIFSLPMYAALSRDDQDRVIDGVRDVLGNL